METIAQEETAFVVGMTVICTICALFREELI